MPTLNAPVVGPVRVADRRRGRFLLVNADTGAWGVTNRAGLLSLPKPEAPSAVAALRDQLLAGEQATTAPGRDALLYVIYKLTDTCNFRCVYCYDRKFARRKDTARRDASIRAVLDQALASGIGRIHLLFHGGEPLEEISEMRALVAQYGPLGPDRIQFSVQTNGSLLDADIVGFFNQNLVGLSVSLDGTTAAANALRMVGGRPDPYTQLNQRIDEIDGLARDRLGLVLTVGRHNAALLADSLVGIERDGFRSASLSFMQQVGPGAQGASTRELVTALLAVVARIVEGELSELAVWTLIEWVRQLTERRTELTCLTSPCGAGRTVITVLPSGEIGPCDSIFDPRYYTPDLPTYLAQLAAPQSRLGALAGRERHATEPCRSCDVAPHCNGTCPGNAILQSGHPETPADDECAFHYAWIIELMWVLSDPVRGPALLDYCAMHRQRRTALRTAMTAQLA
jgi:uncharacterized protein